MRVILLRDQWLCSLWILINETTPQSVLQLHAVGITSHLEVQHLLGRGVWFVSFCSRIPTSRVWLVLILYMHQVRCDVCTLCVYLSNEARYLCFCRVDRGLPLSNEFIKWDVMIPCFRWVRRDVCNILPACSFWFRIHQGGVLAVLLTHRRWVSRRVYSYAYPSRKTVCAKSWPRTTQESHA